MRVLVAHSFYRLAGGEDRYVDQQVQLLRREHKVALLSHANAELRETPATAARMTYSPAERRRVARAVSQFRPDLVHVHNPYPAFGPAVHLVAERRGLPLVATAHNLRMRCPNGLMFTEGRACHRCEAGNYLNAIVHDCFPQRSQAAAYAAALWVHRFGMRLDRKVTLHVAPSQFIRDRLLGWGVPPHEIEVVRNFTDFQPEPFPPGTYGLYVGRIAGEKGLDVLVEALAAAGDPPFHIVGTGPVEDDLRGLARRLGLGNTQFLGQQSHDAVRDELKGARFVAFTSKWDENAPLAALEAMASARPLLVTRTGGLTELVGNGGGTVVGVGDVEATAAAIRTLMNDTELCAKLGSEALDSARAWFTPDVHLASLEAAYRKAIALAPAPPPRRRPVFDSLIPATTQAEAAAKEAAPAASPVAADVTSGDGTLAGARPAPAEIAAAPADPAIGTRPPAQRAPTVLMVHCYYRDLGGENLSFEAEARLLASHGQRIFTYTRDNREIDRLGIVGRGKVAVRTTWADDSYRAIRRLIARGRPDVVHFQNTFPLISPAAYFAAHREGVAVVQALRNYRPLCANGLFYRDGHVCEDCFARPVPWPGLAHACYRDSSLASGVVVSMQTVHNALGTWRNEVDVYVAPSEFSRSKFIAAGFPADRVLTKPNFVHPDPGVATDPGTYAVFAGRLAREKGVMTLLDAWRRVPRLPLRIAGDGPLRQRLRAYIDEHHLGDRVELLGYQAPERVLELMKGARVAIFASEWYETFGRVAAEAYACGVPVIASRLGAVTDIVRDGRTGLHFQPGDAEDLAAKVDWLESHPDEHRAMSEAARLEYEQKYTADRNFDRLMVIYDRAREIARSRA